MTIFLLAIDLGAQQVGRIVKKTTAGSFRRKHHRRPNHKWWRDAPTPNDLLKLWDLLGLVHLMYLDESGCYGHCPTGYVYAIFLATKTPHPKCDGEGEGSISRECGTSQLWVCLDVRFLDNPDLLKTYGVASTTMAQLRLEYAGKLTAIIQNNASVHSSLLTQQWELSSAARQVIFFLPPYSPLQETYWGWMVTWRAIGASDPAFLPMSTIWRSRSPEVWKPGLPDDSMLNKAFSV